MFPAKVSRGAVDVMVDVSRRRPARRRAQAGRRSCGPRSCASKSIPRRAAKLDKPLKYASSRNVPVLAILGEDEQARGEVAVRDLQTRQQDAAPRTRRERIAQRVTVVRSAEATEAAKPALETELD